MTMETSWRGVRVVQFYREDLIPVF